MIAVEFPAEPPEGTKYTLAVAEEAVGLDKRICLTIVCVPLDGTVYRADEADVVSCCGATSRTVVYVATMFLSKALY
jgi:hypothetical protein